MDAKQGAKQGARSYVDFEPSFEWSRAEDSDILRVHLPGFKREQLRVQVDNYGKLRINGERPLEGNRWSRFWKDFSLPSNCNVSEIRAKFENETLFIMLPKEITRAKPTVPNQLPPPSKPAAAVPPKPAPAAELPKPPVSEPKPTVAQAPVARPRDRPTNGKLGEMLSTKKEEEIDEEESGAMTQPIGDKKETERKEEKPVEEKRIEKPSITEAAGPVKEPAQAPKVSTGIEYQPRRGLLLNVAVAIIVLVGLGFYLSFKLRKGVADGDQSNIEEL